MHMTRAENLERETGFEPATSSLARKRTTTVLLPHHFSLTLAGS